MKYLWMIPVTFYLGIGCFGGEEAAPPPAPEEAVKQEAKEPPPEARAPEGHVPTEQTPFDKASAQFKAADTVQIEWSGSWYDGTVVEVQDAGYLISYNGYSDDWNEVVREDRIRATTAAPAAEEVAEEEIAAVEEVPEGATEEAVVEAPEEGAENTDESGEETVYISENFRSRTRAETRKTGLKRLKKKAVAMGYKGVRGVRVSNIHCDTKGKKSTCKAKVTGTAYRPKVVTEEAPADGTEAAPTEAAPTEAAPTEAETTE